jgi:hypothetical protein
MEFAKMDMTCHGGQIGLRRRVAPQLFDRAGDAIVIAPTKGAIRGKLAR